MSFRDRTKNNKKTQKQCTTGCLGDKTKKKIDYMMAMEYNNKLNTQD